MNLTKTPLFFLLIVMGTGLSCKESTDVPARQLVAGQTHKMIYFGQTQKVLLVNGTPTAGSSAASLELWEWTGTDWKFINDNGPETRNFFSMTYDAGRGVLVLFGGHTNLNKFYDDVWEWDGASWMKFDASDVKGREDAGIAYDAKNARTVIFGGSTTGFALKGDTWSWDGTAWSKLSDAGPAARFPAIMSYDVVSEKVLLFGGHAPTATAFENYKDTWRLEGATWQLVATTGADPGFRLSAPTVFNNSANRLWSVTGYGGADSNAPKFLNEIWSWNQTEWIKEGSIAPDTRSGSSVAFDKSNGQIILFGGNNQVGGSGRKNDTWIWDGTSWRCANGC